VSSRGDALTNYGHMPDSVAADPRGFEALLRDGTFASLACMRRERTAVVTRFASGLGRSIREVLDLLDGELARR